MQTETTYTFSQYELRTIHAALMKYCDYMKQASNDFRMVNSHFQMDDPFKRELEYIENLYQRIQKALATYV